MVQNQRGSTGATAGSVGAGRTNVAASKPVVVPANACGRPALQSRRGVRIQQADAEVMIRAARRFMFRHPEVPFNLDALAKLCGLSRWQFARLFKVATSLTPMGYLRRVRVERAKQMMLAEPTTKLEAVAAAVGIGSHSQLTHTFRRVTGESPTAWQMARQRAKPAS